MVPILLLAFAISAPIPVDAAKRPKPPGELSKAFVAYEQLYGKFYGKYPNNFDALGDGTKIIDYFANGVALPAAEGGPGKHPANDELKALTLTEKEIRALAEVGITEVQGMVTSAVGAPKEFDPTFIYYLNEARDKPIILKDKKNMVLAGLDPTKPENKTAVARCRTNKLSLTGRYVALGIGPRCDMVGKVVQSAPVHFGADPSTNPEYGYQRFVAIFKVSDTAEKNFTKAELVGIFSIEKIGLFLEEGKEHK